MNRTSFRIPSLIARTMALLMLTAVAVAWAAKPPVQVDRAGIALHGYDAVAYFAQNAAVKGTAEHSHSWHGAVWHFSSAANRDTFAGAPEKYAPQYGGYCGYAVSKGSTADIDPKAFTVHDGKLYVNYSTRIMKKWRQDIPGNITKANANWPKVLQ